MFSTVEFAKTYGVFRILRKTGNVLEMYWGIFIVLRIDEECLVWLETVPAE